MNDDCGRGKLTPVSSLGDRALFHGRDGSLSISAKDLPSLSRNSIYFNFVDSKPALMHSLTIGSTEDLAAQSQIHDGRRRIRPSVQPFTVADHLLTFCHPREWTKGLMFHEYHCIPPSFKQLRKKIMAQESLVDIGRAPDNASSSAVVSSIEEYRIFALMMREFNQRLGYWRRDSC